MLQAESDPLIKQLADKHDGRDKALVELQRLEEVQAVLHKSGNIKQVQCLKVLGGRECCRVTETLVSPTCLHGILCHSKVFIPLDDVFRSQGYCMLDVH